MQAKIDYLSRELLAKVSRSFYLTLRMLPKSIRQPLSLAYLLARTSDTIADTKSLPLAARLSNLTLFCEILQSKALPQDVLTQITQTIMPYQDNLAEQQLLARLEDCFAWLAMMNSADQQDIVRVLTTITQGQMFDIEYFQRSDELVSLQTLAELDHYTYSVAGCVGEFWTNVCWRYIPNYSKQDEQQVQQQALAFGKGLQLVNILRDLPQDLRAGRCYLPEHQLQQYGLVPAQILQQPDAIAPVLVFWIKHALAHLDEGWQYVCGLNSRRIRYALILPILIGLHTLLLLTQTHYISQQLPVKISRWQVRRLLILAGLGVISPKMIARYYQRLRCQVLNSCAGLLAVK